jgi:DNA sulfur modification protein DndB
MPPSRPNTAEDKTEPFSYVLWAIRGVQAGRPYFVAMCPLKLIPKLFLYDEEELPSELRAQRTLNRARVPEIARYITDNPKEYVFSSITASVDSKVVFKPVTEGGAPADVGQLVIPMSARFIINDGQHRRAAIEEALKIRSDVGEETISVVFFLDSGLKRSQQMFADLNKHAVRPTKSLGILYDLRDPQSQLARKLVDSVEVFRGLTEMEKTTISNRSIKLFTLSAIYLGTKALLVKTKTGLINSDEEQLAIEFWNEVGKHIPDWTLVKERKATAAEMRREYIHAHGLALHVLGIVGATLLAAEPRRWKDRLKRLSKVDWSRSNSTLWEGRALVGGRVSKAYSNVLLTSAIIKKVLDLPLSPEETRLDGRTGSRKK